MKSQIIYTETDADKEAEKMRERIRKKRLNEKKKNS